MSARVMPVRVIRGEERPDGGSNINPATRKQLEIWEIILMEQPYLEQEGKGLEWFRNLSSKQAYGEINKYRRGDC